MVSVFDVASWFLHQGTMTHKKLQKLCYYAQAWHCALLNGERLFPEKIEAWVHGPVIPALYPRYADYHWTDIPIPTDNAPQFSEKTTEVLESVYESYGDLTGQQLEWLTHNEDPWLKARGHRDPLESCTEEITIESMQKFYSDLYSKGQND